MRMQVLTIIALAAFIPADFRSGANQDAVQADSSSTADAALEGEKTYIRILSQATQQPSREARKADLMDRLEALKSGASRARAAGVGLETAERVHVIPAANITAENIETITEDIKSVTEDMLIMCHLLHKELRIPGHTAGGHGGFSGGSRGYEYEALDLATALGVDAASTRGIYLEGFGALFLMKVKFPLSASAQTKPEPPKPKEAIDSAWEQAKRDIHRSEGAAWEPSLSPDKYHAYKVEYLKEKLVKALKYAANIRMLGSGDAVVVTVRGRRTGEDSADVLTIRTKKSDIDAFYKGELDVEQFRQKVTILAY